MTLLGLKNVSAELGRRKVLNEVTLDVAAGEFVGLIGPNGAGKSTLLRAALGLVPATGEITIAGQAAETLTAPEKARRVAYLPQDHEIAWAISVERLIMLGRMPYRTGGFGQPDAADRAAVEAAMRRMDVDGFRERRTTALSGGEKVRVLIARTLAQGAPLLLADEPTAALDPAHQISLMRTFAGLVAEGGGVVASLHDLGLAARWCSRLILMDRGAIVAEGRPADVLTPERLARVYGIRAHIAQAEGGIILQPLDLVAPTMEPTS